MYRKAVCRIVLAVFVCYLAGSAWPQTEAPPTPEMLMDNLRDLIIRSPKGGSEEAANWNCVLQVREELGKSDPSAVPLIEKRIAAETDARVRSELTYALGMIPGEAVDRILLRLYCSDSEVRSSAGMQLTWRTEHNGRFRFVVPQEQIDAMLEEVRRSDYYPPRYTMQILGMCAENPIEPIMKPIIELFLFQIDNPPVEGGEIPGSWCSPRVFFLNQFLMAFSYMGDRVLPELNKAMQAARQEKKEERAKWLAIALGRCGDPSVADDMENVVLNDPDPYTRAWATWSYANSAGERARPILERLLEDKTETEYHNDVPELGYFIANMAHDALVRLDRASKTGSEAK